VTAITINITPAGQVSQAQSADAAGPPPSDALGGQVGGAGLGQQGPPPAELGASQAGSVGAGPPPDDAMGSATAGSFAGGAPAPLPLEEVDERAQDSQ
jgi:hypothetical protein